MMRKTSNDRARLSQRMLRRGLQAATAAMLCHPATPLTATDTPTFSRDVATIFYRHCSECHRPNDVAPFSLLTFTQARPYARSIARAVTERSMPPWMPEPGYGDFRDARLLSADEIELVRRWAAAGAPEGDPGVLPPQPPAPPDWRLGRPNLVLELDDGYSLPANGSTDLFRNFVVALEGATGRYVRAIELRPRDRRLVHHASMLADRTGSARRLDELDDEPGFPGMAPGVAPGGHFFGWTPGHTASGLEEGMAWQVKEGTDLVVQLHLLPTGEPQTVAASLGLHFTDVAPTRQPATLHLTTTLLDIAAGEPAYRAADELVLPVAVEATSLYPHMHYLGRELKVFAILPDGGTTPLLWIKDWDFNWQDEYRYEAPVPLPAGSRIRLELTYDNSAANPRNPHRPPRPVRWGPRSSDEMGDVWIKVVPESPADVARLERHVGRHELEANIRGFAHRLAVDPEDFAAHNRLGQIYVRLNRLRDAAAHFEAALALDPRAWHVHHDLGTTRARLGDWQTALGHFTRAVELNPEHVPGRNNLGIALARAGDLQGAVREYGLALELDPELFETRLNLASALAALGRAAEAIAELREVLRRRPDAPEAHNNLAGLLLALDRLDEASSHARRALELRPRYADAHKNLATVLARQGDLAGAVGHRQRAVEIEPNDADSHYYLALGLVELGRTADAIHQLRWTLRLEPEHRDATTLLQRLEKLP